MDMDDFNLGDYGEDAWKAVSRRLGRSRTPSARKPPAAAAPAAPPPRAAPAAAARGGGGLNEAEVKYLADKVSFLDKSVEKLNALGDSVESRMGGAISSAGFSRTAKKFQSAVRSATMGIVQAWSQLYLFILVLLLLFILHQVTLAHATPLSTHTRALEQRFQPLESSFSFLWPQVFEVQQLIVR